MADYDAPDTGTEMPLWQQLLLNRADSIYAVMKSIDAKLPDPPKPPEPAVSRIRRSGRVFSNGQIIPTDVDLVIGAGGLRWKRITIDGEPSDLWTPRDAGGLELSSNDLLARGGHVTEVPDPTAEEPA